MNKFLQQVIGHLFYYHCKTELLHFEKIFYLLMNVLISLKTIFLYIKKLILYKGFGTFGAGQ